MTNRRKRLNKLDNASIGNVMSCHACYLPQYSRGGESADHIHEEVFECCDLVVGDACLVSSDPNGNHRQQVNHGEEAGGASIN